MIKAYANECKGELHSPKMKIEILKKNNINNANSKSHSFAHSRFRASAPSFRFHRWSRAGYAVFRSLSLCVTIGKLSYDICEKAFEKLKGAIQKMFAFVSFGNDFADENAEHDEQLIKQYQLEQILINHTARRTAHQTIST